jgi:4-amino-4-deoxy-L-arabinose transferase-like glycosyltransferase
LYIQNIQKLKDAVRARAALWWLLIGGLLFRCAIACFLPPGFDEAYYFLYTQHLAWSYFDHPVAVAYSTGLGIWLTSVVSPLTIRIGALTLYTGSLWLLYETGRWLFGARVGWVSCAIASLCPLFFLTFGTLSAPDNALIFFWSAALYLCAREFFPRNLCPYQPTLRLSWICVFVGLACLSKYHGFLLGLSSVAFCGLSDRYRCALRSKWIAYGIALFALTIFPILYWNALHEWVSLRFQLADRFTEEPSGYSLLRFLGVLLSEMGFLFPTIGIPLWWVSLQTLVKAMFNRPAHNSLAQDTIERAKTHFLLWTGLPTALGFTLLGGLTHTFPAWPAPGLWSLTLLLGHAANRWPRLWVKRWLQGTGLVVGSLLLFALTHITLGTLQKPSRHALFGGFVSVQQDPSTALIDVGQLQDKFLLSTEFQTAMNEADFVVTTDLWLSGYLAMALPQSTPLGSFTTDPRGSAFWFDSSEWLGKDALLISTASFDQTEVLQAMAPYFEAISPLKPITLQRGGIITETFYSYRAQHLTRPYRYESVNLNGF